MRPARRRRLPGGRALLAATLLLSSCSAAQPGAARAARPAAAGASTLRWGRCQGMYECTTLKVPLSYGDPGGRQLRLALIRQAAGVPSRRIGDLLINPGGPGASTVADFSSLLSLLSPTLRARFTIVGFDPRGVGASSPVRCLPPAGLQAFLQVDTAPSTPTQRAVLVAATRRFVAGCEERSGSLLGHVGTRDVARDMNRIRLALGDRTVSYLGFSYGTFLGAEFAHLFPHQLRAAVLDGALDPTVPPIAATDAQSIGFETDLAALVHSCTATAACPWRPAEPAGGIADIQALLARLAAAAEPAGGGRVLTEGEAFYGIGAGLYSTTTWPLLEQSLQAADQGNGAGLLALADAYTGRNPDGSYSNEIEAETAVSCLDQPWPHSAATYFSAAAAVAPQAPVFGPGNLLSSLACAYWPVRAAAPVAPPVVRGGPPILVIATTGDPATPYAGGVALSRELGTGRLLTRVGEGHTGYPASACVRRYADRYLISLALPPVGTRCGAAAAR